MSEGPDALLLSSSASDCEAAVRNATAVALRPELLSDDVEGAARDLAAVAADPELRWRLQAALSTLESSRNLEALASVVVKEVFDVRTLEEDRARWADLIDVLSYVCPAVLFPSLGQLCAGIDGTLRKSTLQDGEVGWVRHCLQALTITLRKMAASQSISAPEQHHLCQLQVTLEEVVQQPPKFSILLDMPKLWLTRSVVEAVCALAQHAPRGAVALYARLRKSAEALATLAGDHRDMGVSHQAELCHVAWTLCALLECVRAETASVASAAAIALGALCTRGPPALRPALMPCIGFLLQSHGQLLFLHPVLQDALRSGLASSSRALRKRSLETLGWAISSEQESNGTLNERTLVRDVAARLAELQPHATLLLRDKVPSVTNTVVSVIRSFFKLGALDVSSALPRLIAVVLAGRSELVTPVGGLLLELVTTGSMSLIPALAPGLRLAAECLAEEADRFSEVCDESHRFEIIKEACRQEFHILVREAARLLSSFSPRHGTSFVCQGFQSGLLFSLLEGLTFDADLSAELAEALRAACKGISDTSQGTCSGEDPTLAAYLAFPPLVSLQGKAEASSKARSSVVDIIIDLVEVGADKPALRGAISAWVGEDSLQSWLAHAPKVDLAEAKEEVETTEGVVCSTVYVGAEAQEVDVSVEAPAEAEVSDQDAFCTGATEAEIQDADIVVEARTEAGAIDENFCAAKIEADIVVEARTEADAIDKNVCAAKVEAEVLPTDMFSLVMAEVEATESRGSSVPAWKKWKVGTLRVVLEKEMVELEATRERIGKGVAEKAQTGKRPAPEDSGEEGERMLAKAYRGGA